MITLTHAIANTSEIDDLPESQRKAIALSAAKALPADEQQALVQELGLPNQRIINFIWGVLISAVALVLVGSVGSMAWIFIQTTKLDPGAMLTVFTTAMGFVAGLLVKSPVTR